MALTCKDYDIRVADLNERFDDRQYVNNGFFALEKQMLTDRFHDYIGNKNENDKLQKEICNLKQHIAVIEATRPYQDKILQMEIKDVKKDARCELLWHTRRMINGQIVLPSEPVVNGTASAEVQIDIDP